MDNLCVQTLPDAVANSIGLANQGMFIPINPYWTFLDTVKVFLYRTDYPNIAVDSSVGVVGSNAVIDNLFFNKAYVDADYYRVVRHRNALETWSNIGVTYTRGSASHHNFIQPDGQAYGNNQAIISLSPLYRGVYSGDCNQDDIIDLDDAAIVDNASFTFQSGYIVSDLNGDFFADITDYTIIDNNFFNFVTLSAPPGAEPAPQPTEDLNTVPELNTEQDRIKWELHKKVMNEQANSIEKQEKVMPELNEVLKARDQRTNENKAPVRINENMQSNTKDADNTNSNNGTKIGRAHV